MNLRKALNKAQQEREEEGVGEVLGHPQRGLDSKK